MDPINDLLAIQSPKIGQRDIHRVDLRNANIASISATKITAGTITAAVNLGTTSVVIDGANANGARIIFYVSGVPVIVIGSPT